MSDYDLNMLVDTGKEDVLQFIKQSLFSGVSQKGERTSIYTLFYLAMKKSRAELDVLRTRSLILQENEMFLADVKSADANIVAAMARAAGRVSQMKECLNAVDRIVMTQTDADEATKRDALQLQAALEEIERMSVRFCRDGAGAFGLTPMQAMLCEGKAGSL